MSAAFRIAFNHFGPSEEKLNQLNQSAKDNGTDYATEFNRVYGDVGFDSESLFQAGVGLGDGLTLGFTKWLRGSTGVYGGVNTNSTAYSTGNYASFAGGVGRLTYAGIAKGYTFLPGITAQSAVGFRNSLKAGFRLGVGKNWRAKSYQSFKSLDKPLSDSQILFKAGKTDPFFNLYGAGLTAQGLNDND